MSYRDLDDDLAGGSELHLHEVLRRWAAGGLDVASRTVAGSCPPGRTERAGYSVERRSGYELGVPRIALAGAGRRFAGADALVEVWNGFPAWSPLWWRGPRLTVLHHLHGHLWDATFPKPIAVTGRFIERRIAPWCYRNGPVATLARSSADELVRATALRPEAVHVVPPGIAAEFMPRAPTAVEREPVVVCVARLTVAKRVDVVIRALALARERVATARLVVVGTGPERDALSRLAAELGVADAVDFRGHVTDDELVRAYQTARLLATASTSEGWGMTITEAAACGTPAVASAIVGHRDAMPPGGGRLVEEGEGHVGFAAAIIELLTDEPTWSAASERALAGASQLTWDRTAAGLLDLLAADAERRAR